MEFRRALRVLLSRWWLIALAGLAGLGLALGAAYLYNSRIEPVYEARATVEYVRLESDTDAGFESLLAQAKSKATIILNDGSQDVDTDTASGELIFSVTGDDPDVALSEATRLRSAFLALGKNDDQFASSKVELARLQGEIDEVRSQITTMRPASPALDPADTAQREQLAFEINSLRQTIASLRIQVAYPELATVDPATLEADLARSEALLERLLTGLAALPTAETTSTTETLDMLVLQRHLQDLEARYVSISLGLLEQPDAIGPLSDPYFSDQTRDRIGWLTAGAAGLLAGVLAIIVLLLLADRVKRPLWTLEDAAPLIPIGLVDRARPGAGLRPWYPRAGQATRRRQVQALRAALDRAVGEGPVSVGLVGVSVTEADVQALAADLAASVAASGHRVLLIDASFAKPSDLPEYGSDLPDLAGLIARCDTEDAAAAIKQALADRHEVLTDLHALRAGSAADDAADALAGRQFRILLGAAVELDELVVVAAPSFGDPGTEVLSQRLDYLVLVGAARRTTRRSYEEAIGDLSDRYATLFGTVLLEGRTARTRRSSGSKTKGNRRASRGDRRTTPPSIGPAGEKPEPGFAVAGTPVVQVPDAAPVVQVEEPPVPLPPPTTSHPAIERPTRRPRTNQVHDSAGTTHTDRRVAQVDYVSLVDEVETLPPAPEEPTSTTARAEITTPSLSIPLPPDEHAPPPTLRERLLPPRPGLRTASRMSTARPLVVETEPDVEVVIDDRDTSDTSAADRAAAERYLVERVLTLVGVGSESSDIRLGVVDEEGMVPITAGAGSTTAAVRLERLLFADAANRSEGIERGLVDLLEDGRDGLQRWIERGFFRVHARLSDGEPNVWHLSSASGAFQALVVANRFDTDHIRLLRNHDVRRTVLGLRRSLDDASDSNDRVTALTNQISEVRAFDRGLAELEQRDWRPDQKGGLGTLRKLGLLASMEPPAPSSIG